MSGGRSRLNQNMFIYTQKLEPTERLHVELGGPSLYHSDYTLMRSLNRLDLPRLQVVVPQCHANENSAY